MISMNIFDKFSSEISPSQLTNFSYQRPLVSINDVNKDARALGIKAQTKTRIVFYKVYTLVLYILTAPNERLKILKGLQYP